MELAKLFQRQYKGDLVFFLLSMVFWMVVFLWADSWEGWNTLERIIFVAICLLPLIVFQALEKIPAVPVLTRQRNAFVMAAAMLVGATCTDLLIINISDEAPLNWFTTISLATLSVVSFSVVTYLLFRSQKANKVVLDLNPTERSLLFRGKQSPRLDGHSGGFKGVEYLSRAQLREYIAKDTLEEIDLIVISRYDTRGFDSDAVLLKAHLAGIPILDLEDIVCKMNGYISLESTDLNTYLLQATRKTLATRLLLRTRYLLEPLAALSMAIIGMPVFLLVALAIKVSSPGPIFYRQIRTGYRGKEFPLIKFRSMRVDAEANGPQWSSAEDNRVTPLGKFLRRTRLDEMPQLWNIIKGEMSFIGPRPERPEIYEKLKEEIPLFRLRTLVRPGITGWAQISAGYAATSAESLLKLEYDLFYIQHMCLSFDLFILLKTVRIAFVGDKPPEQGIRLVPRPVETRRYYEYLN